VTIFKTIFRTSWGRHGGGGGWQFFFPHQAVSVAVGNNTATPFLASSA
jgi:hypothetical protein